MRAALAALPALLLVAAQAALAQQPKEPREPPAVPAPRKRPPPSGDLNVATPLEALQRARQSFEYGDYLLVEQLLKPQSARIENAALRAEAWRLLGLALFYQGKSEQAAAAFIELLTIEPDEELDPFYVSPRAIAFFDQVKAEAAEALRPIRERKQQEGEERRRAAEAEAAARKQRELEAEERRLVALRPPIMERRVVQREFWVTMLPFGIGQMQNGDQSLGTALATSQIIAGATSAGSALLIEALRDRSTGKFSDSSYQIASRLQVAKWVGAGLFYALWVGGAIHAVVRFRPESTPTELVLPSTAIPAPPPPIAPPR